MQIKVSAGQTIFANIAKHSTFPCGGRGTCGKCRVLLGEQAAISTQDRVVFTPTELTLGWRLACQQEVLTHDMTIEWSIIEPTEILGLTQFIYEPVTIESGYGLALDIGTTTIIMALMDLSSGQVLQVLSGKNPQCGYGADVLSRIDACDHYGLSFIQKLVTDLVTQWVLSEKISTNQPIKRLLVAGNTVMSHIFMGQPVHSIGQYPYDYPIKHLHQIDSQLLNVQLPQFPVLIIPPFGSFVGGDLVAGCLNENFDTRTDTAILIDLGTNGEIVLCHQEQLYAASTAAGPAFEGGNMVNGCPAMAGAIINYFEKPITVDNQVPIGICGSGYLSLISQLVQQGRIDETGYFEENVWYLSKDIAIYQDDIRNFQLAKSAIRTGIEILLDAADLTVEQLDHVYLAGGFSQSMNLEPLMLVGLLPPAFRNKITIIGNASLTGTAKLLASNSLQRIDTIQHKCKIVELASNQQFTQKYMDYIFFEDE